MIFEECGDRFSSIDVDVDRLGEASLSTTHSAIRAILLATTVFSVGMSKAWAAHPDIRPGHIYNTPISLRGPSESEIHSFGPAYESGAFCSPAGCYIWATPDSPIGGGPGGWGDGGGGTGSSSGGSGPPPDPPAIPMSQLPDPEKLACVANKYGTLSPKFVAALDNVWAFVDSHNQEAFSVDTPLAPAGFRIVTGDTALGTDWYAGGTTIIYAAGMSPQSVSLPYVDPDTDESGFFEQHLSGEEMAIFTYAHEVWHQYGSRDELLANGYAASVFTAYKSDKAKTCP
jgi:hypothetical protein